MAAFLRRVARSTPIGFGAHSKSSRSNFHLPLTAIAAISGGFSYLYYSSSPNLVHSDQIGDEDIKTKNIALIPDKWVEFKLQDTARVSHDTHLYRFSFDPTKKLGLDVASCILTRAPFGQDAGEKPKYVIRPYTPISDTESKGYFDLLIKVYPEGKMSQHFASLKPGDMVEVKGPIEKFKYTPNMKKNIGMIAGGSELLLCFK
uniref:cytochrome-b5 reductase n=1 Tax=Medicago truncatula TaxID=3880 RepID=I3T4Q7_MEDTR|nr:unknown [Medicago truncatula]